MEKYFSHCLNQWKRSSPAKDGKSILGLEIDRLKLMWLSLWLCTLGGSGEELSWNGGFV
jgi:hypothetical protein